MNELDLIARFRTEEGATDAGARERSRARLLQAVEESLSAGRRSRGRNLEPATGRGRRLAFAVAAAALIALMVPVVIPHGSPSASATLLRLSKIAGRGSGWENPTRGQYIYTRLIASSPACDADGCVLVDVRRESWVASDGSGRVLETRNGESTDQTSGPGGLAFDDLHQALRLDQAQLRGYLLQRIGPGSPDEDFALFAEIGQLLGETQALPEERIALFRLAASLPGTQDLGPTPDHSGRVGVGVGDTSGGVQLQIVFDRASALVIGEQTVGVDGRAHAEIGPSDETPPGSWTVYSDSGIVDSVTARVAPSGG